METTTHLLVRYLLALAGLSLVVGVALPLSACGTVTSPGDDTDGDDGEGQPDGGAGQPDLDGGGAGHLRVFHAVPEEGATRLYAADVIEGVVQPALLLSGNPANSAAIVNLVRISDDGEVAAYTADAEAAGAADAYVVRAGGDQPGAPIRISDDHGALYVVQLFLEPDGSGAIYGAGTTYSDWMTIEDYYFVDLSGPAPAAPVPLGHGGYVYGGVLSDDGSTFGFLEEAVAYAVSLGGAAPPASLRVSPSVQGGQVYAIALAPDGSAMGLVGDLTTDGVGELYVADLAGSAPGPARKASRPLVAGGDVDVGLLGVLPSHHFSPDGRMLTYLADARTDGVTELFVVDVSGSTPGNNQRVNGDLAAGGGVSVGYSSPFSPDGRKIAYRADQLTDEVMELFVSDVSGGAPTPARRINGPLAAGGDVQSYRFAPDGSGLVYRAEQGADGIVELYYADMTGLEPGPGQRVNVSPVSGGDIGTPLAFSADGAALAYAGDLMVDGRDEVFLAAIADGTAAAAQRVQEASTATSRISSIEFSAGRSLVYAGDTARASCDLWIVDASGATLGEAHRVNVTTARDNAAIRFWLRP